MRLGAILVVIVGLNACSGNTESVISESNDSVRWVTALADLDTVRVRIPDRWTVHATQSKFRGRETTLFDVTSGTQLSPMDFQPDHQGTGDLRGLLKYYLKPGEVFGYVAVFHPPVSVPCEPRPTEPTSHPDDFLEKHTKFIAEHGDSEVAPQDGTTVYTFTFYTGSNLISSCVAVREPGSKKDRAAALEMLKSFEFRTAPNQRLQPTERLNH